MRRGQTECGKKEVSNNIQIEMFNVKVVPALN
jgi:hypothetical protein